MNTANNDEHYVLNPHPSKKILQITIEEQRREYDYLVDAKKTVSNKTLTLSGAGLAMLTFLFSNGDLFIPKEMYGKVFYSFGIILLIGAITVLLYATKPSGTWELPPETHKLDCLDGDDEREYLEYIKTRYLTCYELNSKHYQTKQRLMNISFYPLVFGAIILVTIKIFGGQ